MSEITQEMMKNARTQDWYDSIWKTVGKCVFCDLRDKYILHEENGIVLTVNLYPYIDGQMMAIPRRHVSSPKELSQVEWETLRKMTYLAKKLIKKAHGHKGMWSLIREGGEVANMTVTDHLHMQLIPFDAPDLCKWNYRDLKYSPLENVDLYKKEIKEFLSNYVKFEKKYNNKTELPIVCDLLIINDGKILLQERKKQYKLYPDIHTLPGGHVDNIEDGLIGCLQREVKEETNYEFKEKDVELIESQISTINQITNLKYFGKKTLKPHTFIWNVYKLKKFDKKQKLIPGDDCDELIWMDLDKALKSERVSEGVKGIIKKVK